MSAAVVVFPPWIRWKQRGGADLDQPQGRGPNGRAFCRWCGAEVAAGRQSWCSDACVAQGLQVLGWRALRRYIITRDKICSHCGTGHPGWQQTKRADAATVFNYGQLPYRMQHCPLFLWWEVDHITRIVDGGTDDPANLRLLCHACHVLAGYEQRAAQLEHVA